MSRKIPLGRHPLRIEVARDHLSNLLKGDLAKKETRVGLMLYGHRVGWQVGGFQQIRIHPRAIANGIDESNLHPATDIELVVPLQTGNRLALDKIKEQVVKAEAWGQTPLYESIKQGLEQLALDKPSANRTRQLIVITDGENDPGPLPGGQTVTTANDLIKMLEQPQHQSIQLDIVAVDFEPGPELKRLAKATGGDVQPVQSALLQGTF